MNFYDLVVVGGGPAGSSTAFHASKRGLKVLILEKKKVPRFKLCAGCISERISPYLPAGWEKLVLNRISSGVLGYAGTESFEVPAEEPIAYIIDRVEFDTFLLEKAQQEGAHLLQECEFFYLEKEGARYRISTSKGVFYADHLVGSDGFYSKVATLLGYKKKKFFKALEFFTEGALFHKVLIDIGIVKRGYAWIFPKGNNLSVGIACNGDYELTKTLKDYAEKRGIKNITKIYGWYIPYAESNEDVFYGKERILLTGDAANLTDPLLGEGIYYAFWSGKVAVDALVLSPSDPTGNYKTLLKDLVSELVYAGKIARLGYRFQKVAYRMAKKGALKTYYGLLKGNMSYKEIYVKGWLDFLKEFAYNYVWR
jgi:geranylgeranyl reductase family protein